MFGALVELGIEGDHAAVGVLQLLIELCQLLALARRSCRLTSSSLFCWRNFPAASPGCSRQLGGDLAERLRLDQVFLARQNLEQLDTYQCRLGADMELIHQALRAR